MLRKKVLAFVFFYALTIVLLPLSLSVKTAKAEYIGMHEEKESLIEYDVDRSENSTSSGDVAENQPTVSEEPVADTEENETNVTERTKKAYIVAYVVAVFVALGLGVVIFVGKKKDGAKNKDLDDIL